MEAFLTHPAPSGIRIVDAPDPLAFEREAPFADAIVVQGEPWPGRDSGRLAGDAAAKGSWPLAGAFASGRLHLIVHAGSGPGGVDLEAARRAGAMAGSAPDFATDGFAEATVRAVESLLARRPAPARTIRWGVLGLGSIGRAVVERARARTLDGVASGGGRAKPRFRAFDPFMPHELPELLEVRVVPTLEELVGTSDVLTVHLPAADATRGALDRRALAYAPPGAVIVEAGSGVALDVPAALEALETGRLGGIGLDRRLLDTEGAKGTERADGSGAAGGAWIAPGIEPLDLDFASDPTWRARAAADAIRIALGCLAGEQPRHLLIDPALPRIFDRAGGDLAGG